MSLTNTNREARRPERSVGLRDLRFAGTVAAGLVAGVLGVGALSAPLLGWTDWPDQLQPGGGNDTVTMKARAAPDGRARTAPGSAAASAPPAVPGVGTVTALVITPRRHRHDRRRQRRHRHRLGTPARDAHARPSRRAASRAAAPATDFGSHGLHRPPNLRDSDGDGMPDAWETQQRHSTR